MSQFAVGGFLIHRFDIPSIFLVGNFWFLIHSGWGFNIDNGQLAMSEVPQVWLNAFSG